MNKVKYLQLLKQNLSGRIQENELNDILSDYDGFFISGMEEGKTEAEISAELGDPGVIARSILETEVREQSLSYAPVYKRIPALIIDVIVAGLPFIWFAPRAALGAYFQPQVFLNMTHSLLSTVRISSHQWISQLKYFWFLGIVISVLWFFLINPLCMYIFKGQSLGKKLTNIRVVSADGANASLLQIITREWVGKFFVNALGSLLPSILALSPSIASLIWASVSRRHMTIHDAIAHTCVVNCQKQTVKKG